MNARPRILVAEDDPDLLRMLEHVMGAVGDVESAVDGQDAFEKAQANPPDIIVTDVMMPRMDGYALAKALKAIPKLARIPVVMLTAKVGTRDVIAGINAGARFYVTKPFKTPDLVAKVKKALAGKAP